MVHTLPSELLEQIFTYYTHDDDDDYYARTTSTQPVSTYSISAHPLRHANPLVLGHVCSRWMSISRNQQRLWTKMYITEPESAKQIAMARYWLSLSCSSPLTLSLMMSGALSSRYTPITTASKDREKARADAARRYVDLFLARYDQWQSITIRLSGTSYLPSLLSSGLGSNVPIPEHAPPMLKHVDIDYGCWMQGDRRRPDHAILSVLYSAPELDSVAWSAQWYAPTRLLAQEIFPHWKNLKKLTYRQGYSYNALKAADAVALLAACPLLEHFDALFYPEHGHGDVHDVQDIVTHRHLRVLDLTIMQTAGSRLLDALCLPALEEVKITVQSDYGDAMNSAFVGLLERSECTLQRLFFDNSIGGADNDVLLEMLKSSHLQRLKILQLAGLRTSSVMDLLTRRADVEETLAVLPNLERLEFQKFAYGDSPSIDVVEKMLVSRSKRTEGMIVPGVNNTEKEDPGHTLSALRHVELRLGALGVWEYYRLARLGSWENRIILTSTGTTSDVRVPPFVQVLSGMRHWISHGARFSWEH